MKTLGIQRRTSESILTNKMKRRIEEIEENSQHGILRHDRSNGYFGQRKC